ncbi:MAG TPA: hypothetical protein VGM84_20885 [Steroidobacteraceae bacterium]
MNVAVSLTRARDSHRVLTAVVVALGAALLWFVTRKHHYLTDYSPACSATRCTAGCRCL